MSKKFIIEQLEARLMLSADFLPVPFDAALPVDEGTSNLSNLESPLIPNISESHNVIAEQQRHEIVFIDSRVPDYQKLVDDIIAQQDNGTHLEIIVLDSNRDGIEQISNTLNKYTNIDAVHLFSHGSDGAVQLGNAWLNNDTLDAYADSIEGWKNSLTGNADLLFYGCDIAAGENGYSLVESLSILTGADIAASNDLTGIKELGGDWQLEQTTGTIETEIAASSQFQLNWDGLLDISSLSATQDNYIIKSSPTNNNGLSSDLIIDRGGGGIGDGRALLEFDLSSLPAGATINSATLRMESTAIDSPLNVNVYEVTSAWSEGAGNSEAANWTDRMTGTAWTTAGGDYNATEVATLNASSTGQHTWDITSLVQAWYSGAKVNNGLMLASPDTGVSTITYFSREGSTMPVLEINYTPATGNNAFFADGTNTPKTNPWDGSTFTGESDTAAVGSTWRTIQGADSPTRNEQILVGVESSGNITAIIGYGSTWNAVTIDASTTLGTVSESYWWSADIAYEQQRGNAMLVWCDNSRPVNKLMFSVWDGNTWTAAQAIGLGNYAGGEPQHMQLVADPGSNEMILVVNDINADDYALVWDGTSWGNGILLDSSGTLESDQTAITVAYEAQSGNAMVFYGKNPSHPVTSKQIWYQTWNGTNWGTPTWGFSGLTSKAQWITAASDPLGNSIVIGVVDSTGTASLSIWNGTTFVDTVNTIGVITGTTFPGIDVSFETLSGDALAVFSQGLGPKYMTWNSVGGWSGAAAAAIAGVTPNTVILDASPDSDQIMLTFQDSNSDIYSVFWNGTTWSAKNLLETTSGEVKNQPFVFLWDQATIANSAPTITGASTGQAVNDNATVSPFSGVTIGDVDNPAQTLTVTVSLDVAAKGSFTTLNGFTDAGSGNYTFSGTAAAATTAIRGMVFTPTTNRDAPASTETTTLTITVNDGVASNVTNNTTTVVSTSVNDAPTITGATAGQAVNDNATVTPFSGVTLGDVDNPAQTLTVTVSLDVAAKGSFTTLNGFTDAGSGNYTFSGTAAAATTAIRGMVFTPSANRVVPASTETTTLTITVNDGVAGNVTNNTTTVVSTSINNAPTITGASAGQAVNDNATVSPFSGVTIGDVDNPAQTLTVTVSLDVAAKGSFTTLNGFTDAGSGNYTFSGTAAVATTAIRGMVFTPAANRVAPAGTETTTLTITVNDGVAGDVTNNTTTVVSTSINNAPTISNLSGDSLGYAEGSVPQVIDQGTLAILQDVDSVDFNTGNLTVSIVMGNVPSEDVLSILSQGTGIGQISFVSGIVYYEGNQIGTAVGGSNGNDLVVTFNSADATADAVTALIRNITYEDTNNINPATGSLSVRFIVNDGDGLTSSNYNTTVTVGKFNSPPTFTGLDGTPGYTENTVAVILDSNATVSDPELDLANDYNGAVLTLARNGGANSEDQFGFADGNGLTLVNTSIIKNGQAIANWDITSTPGQLTVTFTNANGEVPLSSDADFVLQQITYTNLNETYPTGPTNVQIDYAISDGNAGAQGPGGTKTGTGNITVAITGANDEPTISGASAAQAVNDNATVSPFTGVTIGDVDNPAQTLTVTVSLDVAAKGSFTTLSGFTDAGNGNYTFSGTAAAATTAIRGMVFTPTANRVTPASTETTTLTITVNDGVAGDVTNNTTTVVSTSVNNPSTITGASAAQAVNDNATVSPFSGVTIGDVDNPAQTLTVTVSLDVAAKGSFTTLNGFTDAGSGNYAFSGTADAATTAIRGMVFTPAANRVTPASTETTTLTINVIDGVAAPVSNTTTTVVSTSVNEAPTITGTSAAQAVNDNATVEPFSGVTIGDVDNPAQTLSVTVSLDVAAKGSFTTLNGFTDAGSGNYTFSGTAAAATTAIRGMVFTPATARVVLGSTETTTLTINVNDGVAAPASDNTTTVVSTAITNNAPILGNNTLTISEGNSVVLSSSEISATDINSLDANLIINVAGITGGQFELVSNAGVAITSFTQAQVTASLVKFVHDGGESAPSYNVTVSDGSLSSIASAATVIFTNQNDNPVLGNNTLTISEGGSVILSGTNLSASDVDNTNSSLTFTVSGISSGQFEFVSNPGVAITSFTQSQVTASQVKFVHDGSEVSPGYNLTVSDGSLSDGPAASTINFTRLNDAPTATNLTASENYTEDSPLNLTDIVVSDLDSTNVTVTLTLSDTDAGSLSTGTSGAVTSTFAGGIWTASGAVADVNALLTGLTFTPSLNYDSNFTITTNVSDGTTSISGVKSATVTSVGDAPQVGNAATLPETLSESIVISPNASDGVEVTHFRITGITNGTLYHTDGTTQINNGDYITLTEAQSGLKFQPDSNTVQGSFSVRPSKDGVTVDPNSGSATSTISLLSAPAVPVEETLPETEEVVEPEIIEEVQDTVTEDTLILEDTMADESGNADGQGKGASVIKSSGRKGANASSSSSSRNDTGAVQNQVTIDFKPIMERLSHSEQSESSNGLSILSLEKSFNKILDKLPIFRTSYENLRNSLDDFRKEADMEMENSETVIGSAIAVSTGLSVGYVIWMIRGGMLVSSLMSSMPAWQIADPLPVLTNINDDDDDDDDDESLESIIKNNSDNDDKKEEGPEPTGT